jgi:hypothetical protein
VRPEVLTDAKALDHLSVTVGVLALEIIEQTASLSDELEQPAARVMVFAV